MARENCHSSSMSSIFDLAMNAVNRFSPNGSPSTEAGEEQANGGSFGGGTAVTVSSHRGRPIPELQQQNGRPEAKGGRGTDNGWGWTGVRGGDNEEDEL